MDATYMYMYTWHYEAVKKFTLGVQTPGNKHVWSPYT